MGWTEQSIQSLIKIYSISYKLNASPILTNPIRLKAKLAAFVSGIPNGIFKNSTAVCCKKFFKQCLRQQNCWKIVNLFQMNSEVISFLRLESLRDFRYQNSQRTWLLIFWYKPCLKSSQPYHDHHTYTAR